MRDQQDHPHKKAVFSLLLGLLALPAVIALASVQCGIHGLDLVGGYFGFVDVTASRTHFPDMAEIYYLVALFVLPIQFTLIGWYISGFRLAQFQRTLASYSENERVISIGTIVLLTKRVYLWLLSVGLFSVVFLGIFIVGTGYRTSARTPTATIAGFLLMNTAGIITLQCLVLVLAVFAKFELHKQNSGNVR